VDPSALIFVALAVAWAVYLVPKALQHHDEAVRSRSVERFSHTMRVLARREPVGRREARLVVTPGRTPSVPTVSTKASTRSSSGSTSLADAPLVTTPLSVRRAAAQRAARRRRRVLGLVLLVNAAVIGLAVARIVTWPWVAVPATLLVAWLVACRVMVTSERAAARRPTASPVSPASPADRPAAAGPASPEAGLPVADAEVPTPEPAAEQVAVAVEASEPVDLPAAPPVERAPGSWDMVPTTLPTYVSKPAATRRTVQTIDLESTGVWSSGRSDSDSALAREAEQREATARAERDAAQRRATGS
jgi:hypothetical protein